MFYSLNIFIHVAACYLSESIYDCKLEHSWSRGEAEKDFAMKKNVVVDPDSVVSRTLCWSDPDPKQDPVAEA